MRFVGEEQRTENNKQILSFLIMTFSDDMYREEVEWGGKGWVEEITSIQQQIFCLYEQLICLIKEIYCST